MRRHAIVAVGIAWRAMALAACRAPAHVDDDPGPALQILGEAAAIRSGDPVPATSPWFDGTRVTLEAARGETLGIQVLQRGGGAAQLTLDRRARPCAATTSRAHTSRGRRPELYGGSRGAGDYPDALTAADGPGDRSGVLRARDRRRRAAAGVGHGELAVGDLVAGARCAGRARGLDRDDAGAAGRGRVGVRGSARICVGRAAGVVARGAERCGARVHRDVSQLRRAAVARSAGRRVAGAARAARRRTRHPGRHPRRSGRRRADAVRAWIAATAGTHQVPFAIPIDEPRDAAAFARVEALATAVRAASGGATSFRYAVTAAPSAALRGPIDLYLAGSAAHLAGDAVARWTYNGKPPEAGAMVVDAAEPGVRTWGWIAWRYHIPTWYAWDALYWPTTAHDRHGKRRCPARRARRRARRGDRSTMATTTATSTACSCRARRH